MTSLKIDNMPKQPNSISKDWLFWNRDFFLTAQEQMLLGWLNSVPICFLTQVYATLMSLNTEQHWYTLMKL